MHSLFFLLFNAGDEALLLCDDLAGFLLTIFVDKFLGPRQLRGQPLILLRRRHELKQLRRRADNSLELDEGI